MKRPNANWNDFCTQVIQKVLLLEIFSTFLSYEEQTKAELASLGQEIENLRSELREYHVNAIAVSCRTFRHGQQGRKRTTRFCDYCRKNGHTLNWCRKKMPDEEVRKCDRICFLKRKSLPYRTIPLMTSMVNHKTIKP